VHDYTILKTNNEQYLPYLMKTEMEKRLNEESDSNPSWALLADMDQRRIIHT